MQTLKKGKPPQKTNLMGDLRLSIANLMEKRISLDEGTHPAAALSTHTGTHAAAVQDEGLEHSWEGTGGSSAADCFPDVGLTPTGLLTLG